MNIKNKYIELTDFYSSNSIFVRFDLISAIQVSGNGDYTSVVTNHSCFL